MDLNLVGETIEAIEPGYALGIVISGDNFFSLESPFSVITSPNSTTRIDPESDPEHSHPVLEGLIGQPITNATATDNGQLSITFANGTVLQSEPTGGDYEPWNFVGPDGLRVVAMPSGSLTVWSGTAN